METPEFDLRPAQDEFSTNRQTAHEYVRTVLRRAILKGELAGGTRLVQAELAAMLEVSTTPVREALRDSPSGLRPVRSASGALHELSLMMSRHL
jgi:hypothetical protein